MARYESDGVSSSHTVADGSIQVPKAFRFSSIDQSRAYHIDVSSLRPQTHPALLDRLTIIYCVYAFGRDGPHIVLDYH